MRNTGLAQASGVYLMYVDGDDYVAENYVEAALRCAEKHQADVVIFDFEEIEEATGRHDRWSMRIPGNKVTNAKEQPRLLITTPSPCNKLYRRAFWQSTGLTYPVGRNYEDLTMTPRLLVNAGHIVYLQSEPLYYYILHEGSIMRSRNFEKSYLDRTAAIRDILSYFQERGLYERISRIAAVQPGFWEYVPELFPKAGLNPYVKKCLSKKDRIMLRLIRWRLYGVIRFLSRIRRQKDRIRPANRQQ